MALRAVAADLFAELMAGGEADPPPADDEGQDKGGGGEQQRPGHILHQHCP